MGCLYRIMLRTSPCWVWCQRCTAMSFEIIDASVLGYGCGGMSVHVYCGRHLKLLDPYRYLHCPPSPPPSSPSSLPPTTQLPPVRRLYPKEGMLTVGAFYICSVGSKCGVCSLSQIPTVLTPPPHNSRAGEWTNLPSNLTKIGLNS